MEIGKLGRCTKYAQIWKAAAMLTDGEALPVECETVKDARLLAVSAFGNRKLRLRANRQGTMVYIRRKGETE